jgi:hypothetical protein
VAGPNPAATGNLPWSGTTHLGIGSSIGQFGIVYLIEIIVRNIADIFTRTAWLLILALVV